jgi:drug/metabolite transporter (DMT)-like permease
VWWLIVSIGLVLMLANLVLQYGLARLPANQAIVILLVELPAGALAAYWLAGETMRATDWLGGALIVLACLASSRAGATGAPNLRRVLAP